MKLVLASASPRRRELLERLTPNFTVRASDADEQVDSALAPEAAVLEIAHRKGLAVPRSEDELLLSADTVVVVDGHILGKPTDEEDAKAMLRHLSGRRHRVLTAVWLFGDGEEQYLLSDTEVQFLPLSEAEIDWYVSTGEPMDKAGAYGVQGLGGRFVSSIFGDYYNVMGFPLSGVYQMLRPHLEQGLETA